MRALKIAAIALLVYVAIVFVFESLLGYFQPTSENTVVLTTFEADGTAHDRVLTRIQSGDELYVAANHWPRAWYSRALANPDVKLEMDGTQGDYRAVPATEAEHERVDTEHALPVFFRILTGFPPRYFVRLEAR